LFVFYHCGKVSRDLSRGVVRDSNWAKNYSNRPVNTIPTVGSRSPFC
jgi:hypothetical protein